MLPPCQAGRLAHKPWRIVPTTEANATHVGYVPQRLSRLIYGIKRSNKRQPWCFGAVSRWGNDRAARCFFSNRIGCKDFTVSLRKDA
jgi:hypothetical protein